MGQGKPRARMNTDASISPQAGHGPDEDSRSATSEHPVLPSVCPATCTPVCFCSAHTCPHVGLYLYHSERMCI